MGGSRAENEASCLWFLWVLKVGVASGGYEGFSPSEAFLQLKTVMFPALWQWSPGVQLWGSQSGGLGDQVSGNVSLNTQPRARFRS